MISPRVAIAAGFAGAIGAALILAGRLDGSVVTVTVLTLSARAAALAASEAPFGQRAIGRIVELVPVWIGIAIVGAVRAGSGQLGDIRGANAVAGLPVAHGEVVLVVACWAAVVAGALALIAPGDGTFAVTTGAPLRLELVSVACQAAIMVSLFSGPQVAGVRDAVPWVAGALAAGAAIWFGRRISRWEWTVRAATGIVVVAVVLAMVAGRP